MNSTQALALAYLAISCVGFVWHLGAFVRLVQSRRMTPTHEGLARTLICRVVASLLYIVVGTVTAINDSFPIIGLAIFALTQLIWQANSWLDLRLQRRIATKGENAYEHSI